ncbi:sensor histidine kinase KdpD [Mycobacterium tuberculosis]|nr:sensor histidine kinase KdpD [Mycobacterium tuberculosis]
MTLLFADLCAIFTPYRWMIEHVTTKRGQLRIYLGAAPGVGKTYAMLGEAHRRLERGTDVSPRSSRHTDATRPRNCSRASR